MTTPLNPDQQKILQIAERYNAYPGSGAMHIRGIEDVLEFADEVQGVAISQAEQDFARRTRPEPPFTLNADSIATDKHHAEAIGKTMERQIKEFWREHTAEKAASITEPAKIFHRLQDAAQSSPWMLIGESWVTWCVDFMRSKRITHEAAQAICSDLPKRTVFTDQLAIPAFPSVEQNRIIHTMIESRRRRYETSLDFLTAAELRKQHDIITDPLKIHEVFEHDQQCDDMAGVPVHQS